MYDNVQFSSAASIFWFIFLIVGKNREQSSTERLDGRRLIPSEARAPVGTDSFCRAVRRAEKSS
jgi:hypothetical protein